jgi:cytosine/creatinine deaminase
VTPGFDSPLPEAGRFVLGGASLPATLVSDAPAPGNADGLIDADIVISDGRVEAIARPGVAIDAPRVALDGGMVWPCFVDMHTHIDKSHISSRRANPDGTFAAAIEVARRDRKECWSAEDIRRRMDFSLRTAYAHGIALLRTHIDSFPLHYSASWPIFCELKEEWAGRIELQAVSLYSIDAILDEDFRAELSKIHRRYGGTLGATTFPVPELDRAIDQVFEFAKDEGLDIDFHLDECADPSVRSLRHVADAALRHKFPGKINVGHCCSLALQQPDEASETLARVRDAGISVVSLPMCNLYLQDRHPGRTPRWRGVTLLHEMKALGIPVAVASDNVRDPFYAYGDLDPLEVFREAVRILHLDHPIADWPAAVTRSAAEILGRPEFGIIAAGLEANLVLFRARDWTELLSRPQSDRTVLRAGKPIDRSLPDFRELDDLMGRRP